MFMRLYVSSFGYEIKTILPFSENLLISIRKMYEF